MWRFFLMSSWGSLRPRRDQGDCYFSSNGEKVRLRFSKQMYQFYGVYDFVRMGLRYAFIKWMGRKKILMPDPGPIPKTYTVKQLMLAYGLNIIENSELNSNIFLNDVKHYDPDLFISVACPIVFKEDLIMIPKLGSINVHNALLPRYRGMLPSFWQLYCGEREAGITIHKIDKGIDTGDVIVQHSVPIYPQESLDHLITRTKKESARLMVRVIDSFRRGEVQYTKMKGNGSYYSFPSREDVKAFKRMGKRLL